MKYFNGDFPLFNMYYGMIHNYITYLVLRFYDDVDDFAEKLKSINGNLDIEVRKKLIFYQVAVLNKTTGINVVLDNKDDVFTTGVKLLHVLLGDDFINNKIALSVLVNLTDEDAELTPNYISRKLM